MIIAPPPVATERCGPLLELLTSLGIEASEEQVSVAPQSRGPSAAPEVSPEPAMGNGSAGNSKALAGTPKNTSDAHSAHNSNNQEIQTNIFRVEFENNFAVEMEPMNADTFRVSARICQLGKSQEVQSSQLIKGLNLFREIFELPTTTTNNNSLAISAYDNCLRLLCELGADPQTNPSDENLITPTEMLLNQLEFFASDAYAFKQTYFRSE